LQCVPDLSYLVIFLFGFYPYIPVLLASGLFLHHLVERDRRNNSKKWD
jgi:hypothetical protein